MLNIPAFEERQRRYNREECWRQLVYSRGERYSECRLENFDATGSEGKARALARCREYAQDVIANVKAGRNLMLIGPCGTGKDHLAMAVAFYAVGHFLKVEWINGMDIHGNVRAAMDEDSRTNPEKVIESLVRPDVLWISDPMPPTGALNEFQQQTLYRVVDRRYSAKKPTWITINAKDRADAEKALGVATVDRLRDGAFNVSCNWESYRKPSE